MNKYLFLLLGAVCLYTSTSAQTYRETFLEHFKAKDSTAVVELLTKWEQEKPDDPELFVSYFNYYFNEGRQEVLTLQDGPPPGEEEVLQIQDSTGEVEGYFGSTILYDRELVNKGFEYINRGIAKYPERLDMRFGKIYTLGQVEDWPAFTKEVIQTIAYSDEIKNQWTWSNGEPLEGGSEFFLSSIQDYQLQLFYTEEDSLLVNMRQIAEEILRYYPEDVPSLSNLSITYLLTEEYDKGLEPLFKAEKLNPKDAVVLANIARAYVLKGDDKRALKYYKKVVKYGEGQNKAYAEGQIKLLKEK